MGSPLVSDGGGPDPVAHRYEAAPEHGGDGRYDRCSEIASILATGYLRLLLTNGPEAATPDVCDTSGSKECARSEHEGLEVPERKSVHVSRD